MISPSHDAPLPNPFTLDRDLLEGNLEVKRATGFPCPHCAQIMEWWLGPKTKKAIIDALAQGDFHEGFVFCDKDNCPSVKREGNDSLVFPFIRRISAAADGTITIETLPFENLLQDAAYLRQWSKVITTEGVDRETAHRKEINELRKGFEVELITLAAEKTAATAAIASEIRRADDASKTLVERNGELARAQEALEQTRKENADLTTEVEEKGRELSAARQEIERLQGILVEIDRVTGVQRAEDRLAVIQNHAGIAKQMEEVERLTGRTPSDVLENSRTWAAKKKK